MVGRGSATPGREARNMRVGGTDPEDRSWQEYANCLGVDPDLFFPEKFGIWGGLSERERRRSRRQRAPAARRQITA